MHPHDETAPRRADVFPEEDYTESGPGCLVWGLVWVFALLIAGATVLTAAFAGFSDGVDIARSTAAAATESDILIQCESYQSDLAAGREELAARRLNTLLQNDPIPACAEPLVQMATEYIFDRDMSATATQNFARTEAAATEQFAAATATALASTPQATPELTQEVIVQAEATSPYDLPGLLAEAQAYIAEADYSEAIRTLDAIVAIDPNFQPQQVNTLLFNALTARAELLYISGGSLAEAIQLTNRAEQYGDIGSLNFERSVAQLYLDALPYLDVNYAQAINLLTQVRNLSPNYRDSVRLLTEQYEAYGDAFLLEGNACSAAQQYTAASQLAPQNPTLTQKQTDASNQCSGLATPLGTPGTPDPNVTPATPDPNLPTATPTTGIAPVGQQ